MADARRKEANAAFASGDYASAVAQYTELLTETAPRSDAVAIYCNRSAALLRLGRRNEAAADAQKAVLLTEDEDASSAQHVKALYRLASALHDEGDIFGESGESGDDDWARSQKARQVVRRALAISPEHVQLLALRRSIDARLASAPEPPPSLLPSRNGGGTSSSGDGGEVGAAAAAATVQPPPPRAAVKVTVSRRIPPEGMSFAPPRDEVAEAEAAESSSGRSGGGNGGGGGGGASAGGFASRLRALWLRAAPPLPSWPSLPSLRSWLSWLPLPLPPSSSLWPSSSWPASSWSSRLLAWRRGGAAKPASAATALQHRHRPLHPLHHLHPPPSSSPPLPTDALHHLILPRLHLSDALSLLCSCTQMRCEVRRWWGASSAAEPPPPPQPLPPPPPPSTATLPPSHPLPTFPPARTY